MNRNDTMANKNNKKVTMELGEKIRALRGERKMKLVDVANKTGLSSSFISQVERSLVSPSIETLKKIGDALNTPISYFFSDSDSAEKGNGESTAEQTTINGNLIADKSPVVHPNQRKMLSPQPGVNFYLLNPDMSGPIEFIYNIYEPGASTGEDLYNHEGDECGLILEGELLVTIGDKEYLLKEGDSITFSSTTPHSKKNIGSKKCICVWANTPPWF